ncbi:hypothetical protein GF312_06385 [Candidatus Poribacteria bacterium]|nr:hypothetical protein [Candidatus Poribacteria bacterium]
MGFEKKTLSFFYVWYRNQFGPHSDSLKGNWGGGLGYDTGWVERGRRDSTVPHAPLDGYYDSFSDSTIRRQFYEHQNANIDGIIVSWWGFGHEDNQDKFTHENYSHHATKKLISMCPDDVKVTLYLERSKYGYDKRKPVDVVVSDIIRICEEYGTEKAWMKIDNRPVVFIYGRILGEFRQEYPDDMKAWQDVVKKIKNAGHNPFLIGDSLDPQYYNVFDGLHTYNPIGTTVGQGIKGLQEAYKICADAAKKHGKLFAGTACPGYDDRKLQERNPGTLVMRKEGGYYEDTWEAVLEADADWALICTYNEWWEGSTIESAIEWGRDYLDLTRQYARRFGK